MNGNDMTGRKVFFDSTSPNIKELRSKLQELQDLLGKDLSDLWIDESIKTDENWGERLQQKILQEIEEASIPVAFISPADYLDTATELVTSKLGEIVVSDIVESVTELSVDLISYLKIHSEDIEKLRWDVFEHLVAEFLAAKGFQDVRLVGRDPSTSADIFAVSTDPIGDSVRYFVEVKRTKDRVGIGVINSVLGAMVIERPHYGWDVGMIISVAGFTDTRKISRNHNSVYNLRLKNRNDLERWLEGYKPTDSGLWLPDPSRHIPLPKDAG